MLLLLTWLSTNAELSFNARTTNTDRKPWIGHHITCKFTCDWRVCFLKHGPTYIHWIWQSEHPKGNRFDAVSHRLVYIYIYSKLPLICLTLCATSSLCALSHTYDKSSHFMHLIKKYVFYFTRKNMITIIAAKGVRPKLPRNSNCCNLQNTAISAK